MTNNKGITLIALVITIIVLLILAGVSIAMLTGDNGILNQATNAKDETVVGEVEEACKLAVANLIAENRGTPTGGYTSANVKTSLEAVNASYTWKTDGTTTNNLDVKVEAQKDSKTVATFYINKTTGAVSNAETTTSTGSD